MGPKSSAGPLFEVFTCLPVISFQLLLRRGTLFGLSKALGLGPWSPGPPEIAIGRKLYFLTTRHELSTDILI